MKPQRRALEHKHMFLGALNAVRRGQVTYKEAAKRTGTTTTDVRMAIRALREELRDARKA